jgi:4-diphosphocytidyl-2C-methyl-D-erythritol kinase
MTGSGSAVFGLFREEAVARRAAAQLAQNGTQTFVCKAAGTTVPGRNVPSI